MDKINISPAKKIAGAIEVPGDKSISHRAVMIGSISEGTTQVTNFLMGDDCLLTIEAFREMGIDIVHGPRSTVHGMKIAVKGKGLRGLKKPKKELYLGNSGTTMRIILGILSGQEFECVLSGDESLSKRPMKRVAGPLKLMGAQISPRSTVHGPPLDELYPPLRVKGKYPLKSIRYELPIASAQVKSAVLLAGLYADGITKIYEPIRSRDHTERMLEEFGAKIKVDGLETSIESSLLKPKDEVFVPGDISSASFFIVAALILQSSEITIKNLSLNPTRTGIIDVLKDMGARLEISNLKKDYFEPRGDVTAKSSDLKGINIEPQIIPRLIDELPIIMVAAAFANGLTVIKGAGELRVKETDRIFSMVTNLKKMGSDIKVDGDCISIRGTADLRGVQAESFGDHRTAMSMVIAGLRAVGKSSVLNTDCINKSFPGFEGLLHKLI